MSLDTTGTILTISDGVSLLPLYSARGLSQTLTPIGAAKAQRRTINGQLVDLSLSRFRKYASVISAKDQRPPNRDDVWPGKIVTVECAYLASYPTLGGSPARTPVGGSSFVEGAFTFYQPTIIFMLGQPQGRFDEWEAGYEWSLPMEEV